MSDSINLYLDLLVEALTRAWFEHNDATVGVRNKWADRTFKPRVGDRVAPVLRRAGCELVRKRAYDPQTRACGRDWPARAETMAGLRGLAKARACIDSVHRDDVPGDIIEGGVWRGGMCIFMRGVLKAHGVTDRHVWLADSFEGLPPSDPLRFPDEVALRPDQFEFLSAGADQVRHNFERYGLLDEQVRFILGWFKQRYRHAPICESAVLRLDGDLCDSTMDALEALYPKLSPGGYWYCIGDDYGNVETRRRAHDYRRTHEIAETIEDIDGWAVFWRRSGARAPSRSFG